jgi:hypothetical protein
MLGNSVLLVKPAYYSRYPPVALMKFSTLFKQRGWKVAYAEGTTRNIDFYPKEIYITSLYTYEWRRVHEACNFYKSKFPRSHVTVGGVYATLMPERLKQLGIEVHVGQFPDVDEVELDYSLFPGWDRSIVSSSRGCIRRCPFCAVKYLEPVFECRPTVADRIKAEHAGIVVWDNNLLASPHKENILAELAQTNKHVDFCQGLDIRLIDGHFLRHVRTMRFKMLRFAYDVRGIQATVAKQVKELAATGVRPRDLFFYVLYNFRDSPDLFLAKIQDLLDLGCVAYPMRYEPMDSLERGAHVGQNWDSRSLDMVNRLRRVLGFHGALPPYSALRKKLSRTSKFETAFSLRPERQR